MTGATGTAGSAATTPYKIVVPLVSGAIDTAATPRLYSPTGANIQSTGGWSVAYTTASRVDVTHTQGVPLVNFFGVAINAAAGLSRGFNGTSTATYTVFQNATFTTASIYSIGSTNSGFSAASTGDNFFIYFTVGQ